MLKPRSFVVVLALLLVVPSASCKSKSSSSSGGDKKEEPKEPDATWVDYTSKDGGFTVRIPSTPTVSSEIIPPDVKKWKATAASTDSIYEITWLEIGPGADPAVFLDAQVNNLKEKANAAAVTEATVGGLSAKGMEFQHAGRSHTARMLIVGRRFFAIEVGGVTDIKRDTFFKSFKFDEASSASSTGPCEAYWQKKKACDEGLLKTVPEGSRESMKKGFEQADAELRKQTAGMTPAARDSFCKTAIDSLAANPGCPK